MSPSGLKEIVDDVDPRVRYSGSWKTGGAKPEQNHTTHGARQMDSGSYASFSFTGNYSYVAVYGTIAGKPQPVAKSLFDIDGLNKKMFQRETPEKVLYRQLFYRESIPSPNPDEHVLTIMISDSGKSFWLDYFEIGMDQPPVAGTSIISYSSATGSSVGSQTSPTVEPSIDSQPPTPPISAGVIVGTVVGSMVIVTLIGIAICLYSKQQKIPPKSVLRWETYSIPSTTPIHYSQGSSSPKC